MSDESVFKQKPAFPTKGDELSLREVALTLGRLDNDDEEEIFIPAPINRYLREYQRDGVRFLFEHYKRNEGAVLADDMGLGKTIQVIAFLSAVLRKTGTELDELRHLPDVIKNMKCKDYQLNPTNDRRIAGKFDPVLVVAPACVLYNWLSEFTIWSYFYVEIYAGRSEEKKEVMRKALSRRCDVVLVSYEMCQQHLEALLTVPWNCIIADEVHKIRNERTGITIALNSFETVKRRYGLSGTLCPNNLNEFYSILDWEFLEEIGSAIKQGALFNASVGEVARAREQQYVLQKLRDMHVLRRTKALLADQLPKKVEQVVLCEMKQTQQDAYRAVVQSVEFKWFLEMKRLCECESGRIFANCHGKNGKSPLGKEFRRMHMALLSLLRQIGNHVALAFPRTSNPVYSEDEIVKLLHSGGWRPIKLHSWNKEKRLSDKDASLTEMTKAVYSGKMYALPRLLAYFKAQGDKVLLFSTSTRLLDIVQRLATIHEYNWLRLDGSVPPKARVDLVSKFNAEKSTFLMLVSTTAGGVGLNIVGANIVIIFDPDWNPSNDLQAQDRAYRLGQTRDVFVYRLVTLGGIEEVVYLRQVYKQQLDSIAVSSGNPDRLFKGEELFHLNKLIELRTDWPMSLTEKILERTEEVREEIAGFQVAKYEPNAFSDDDAEEGDDVVHDSGSNNGSDSDGDQGGTARPEVDRLLAASGGVHAHSNRQLLKESKLAKHVAEQACVRLLRDGDSAEPAYKRVAPLLKSPHKSPARDTAKRRRLEETSDASRFVVGDKPFIYGQTPTVFAMRAFRDLAREAGESEHELAIRVLTMSRVERLKLLQVFYERELSEAVQKRGVCRFFDELISRVEPTVSGSKPSPSASAPVFASDEETDSEPESDVRLTNTRALASTPDRVAVRVGEATPMKNLSPGDAALNFLLGTGAASSPSACAAEAQGDLLQVSSRDRKRRDVVEFLVNRPMSPSVFAASDVHPTPATVVDQPQEDNAATISKYSHIYKMFGL